MLRWKLHFILILSLSLTSLGGCQSMSERKRDESLTATLALYGRVLRWQGVQEQGAMLVDPALAPRNDAIRVTSYQVVSSPVFTGENSASQTAVIEYTYDDSQMIKRVIDHQTWEYDSERESWLRANPPPEMPR